MAHLAAYTDANAYLDANKLTFATSGASDDEAAVADAYVRAALANVFPTHVNNWSTTGTPEATPEIVKQIAAMIMAAVLYAKTYSEETAKEPNYASTLWARADALLLALQNGTIGLADVSYDDPGGAESTQFGDTFFLPNDATGSTDTLDSQGNTVAYAGDEDVKFRVGDRF
jgi:hypothetical protein